LKLCLKLSTYCNRDFKMNKQNNVKEFSWGYEIHWANQPTYSGKILVFPNKLSCTDMIFHKDKDKTYFINNGKFKFRWIDTNNGQLYEQELGEGGVWHVPAMRPSSLQSLEENSSITEVNNSSNEQDFFNVFKSDSILGAK